MEKIRLEWKDSGSNRLAIVNEQGIIEVLCTKSGQQRAYQDSLYFYEILTEKEVTDEQVWAFCQENVKKAHNRADGESHTGNCGFPFGLYPYGSLKMLGPGQWSYKVTYPYCD